MSHPEEGEEHLFISKLSLDHPKLTQNFRTEDCGLRIESATHSATLVVLVAPFLERLTFVALIHFHRSELRDEVPNFLVASNQFGYSSQSTQKFGTLERSRDHPKNAKNGRPKM